MWGKVCGVLGILSVMACYGGSGGEARPGASPAPTVPSSTPTATASSSTPSPSPPTRAERIKAVNDRTEAIKHGASTAAAKVGEANSPTVRIALSFADCLPIEECIRRADKQSDKVGAYAGIALALVKDAKVKLKAFTDMNIDPPAPDAKDIADDLDLADEYVRKANDEADKVVAAREEQRSKLEAERPNVILFTTSCEKDPSGCKAKCDHGDEWSCFGLATVLSIGKPPKLSDAKNLMTTACASGVKSACASIPKLDQQIQEERAKIDVLWNDVAEAGDDLATKRHQTAMVAQMANTPHALVALGKMRVITEAVGRERFCPAKKAFLDGGGTTVEFQKRATSHCKDEAPAAQGLSGVSVTLTADCQAAFASTCL